MAKKKFDAATVDAIIAGDHPASAWLSGTGSLDAFSPDVALSAIEAARRQEASARLQAVKQSTTNKMLRKAAGAALHRLKAAGVTVEEASSGQTWTPRGAALDAPPPPAALLGMPDPNGYFPYILVAYGREEACASAGLAGAGQSYVDADHAHLSRSAAREVLFNSRDQQALHPVPFHVALHFLQRAFEEGGKGEPHGFGHLLESVPEDLQTSAKLIDPLEGQESELDTDALHAIEPLLDPREGVYLALSEDQAYGAMGKIGEALDQALDLDEESKMGRIRSIIDDAADDYLNDATRRSWALALDVVTFLSWRTDNEPVRRAARHTALALRADMAARDIPFVREWVNAQLQSVVELFLARNGGSPELSLGEEGDEPESGIVLTDG
ncbi:MAG: hypothetical protein ACI8S6_004273 [Myxococcota bacterium]|jgi:hypothetical protein